MGRSPGVRGGGEDSPGSGSREAGEVKWVGAGP